MIHTSKQSETRLENTRAPSCCTATGVFCRRQKTRRAFQRGAKRYFLTRSAGKHGTSRGCPFCQKNGLVSVTADGRVKESDTSLDWRGCTACNPAEEAGRGEGTARRVMQKDKLAAMNTRRGGIAEMKSKKRAYDLQNAKRSL